MKLLYFKASNTHKLTKVVLATAKPFRRATTIRTQQHRCSKSTAC